jgi:hypothetical protein
MVGLERLGKLWFLEKKRMSRWESSNGASVYDAVRMKLNIRYCFK